MIHVGDQDFEAKVEEPFHEAVMTPSSTSPNEHFLASHDAGRRQVELEGCEMVQKRVEIAAVPRERASSHPLLSRRFRILTVRDMIAEPFRESGIESCDDTEHRWNDIRAAWADDALALDATRVTLFVGLADYDGDAFKNQTSMDKYGIQIDKTSRDAVLFVTNVGSTRSSVACLVELLVKIARELDDVSTTPVRPRKKYMENNVLWHAGELSSLPGS